MSVPVTSSKMAKQRRGAGDAEWGEKWVAQIFILALLRYTFYT